MKTLSFTLVLSLLLFSCKKNGSPVEPEPVPDQFSFSSFSAPGSGKINLAGLAVYENNKIVLNKYTIPGTGHAYYNQLVNVANGFETSFSFSISDLGGITDGDGNNGGDGIAFVVFNSDTTAVKNSGWWSGYSNSMAIEFDTFYNWDNDDPNGNHIGLYTVGADVSSTSSQTRIGISSSVADFSNAGTHTAKVVYQNKKLTVYLDGAASFTADIDLSTKMQLTNGKAYVALSSFSGLSVETQAINSWQFKAY